MEFTFKEGKSDASPYENAVLWCHKLLQDSNRSTTDAVFVVLLQDGYDIFV